MYVYTYIYLYIMHNKNTLFVDTYVLAKYLPISSFVCVKTDCLNVLSNNRKMVENVIRLRGLSIFAYIRTCPAHTYLFEIITTNNRLNKQ